MCGVVEVENGNDCDEILLAKVARQNIVHTSKYRNVRSFGVWLMMWKRYREAEDRLISTGWLQEAQEYAQQIMGCPLSGVELVCAGFL